MSQLETLMKQMKEEQTAGTPSSGAETRTPTQPSVQESQPSEPTKQPSEEGKTETMPNSSPSSEPKPAKNVNAATPEEKREFAFSRRAERDRKRYEAELAKRDAELAELRKSIEEMRKPKEQPKTLKDFKSDEEYVNYLADERVKNALAERDAKAAEEAKKAEEQRTASEAAEREQNETLTAFNDNVSKAFKGDKERAENFFAVVRRHAESLDKILTADPNTANYLMRNADGPLVFEKIVTDVNYAHRVFDLRDPMDRAFELRTIAKELKSETQTAQPTAKALPTIGTPGAGAGIPVKKDIFHDGKSLRDYLRERDHRTR